MKELELNEIKEIELNILKYFDAFCKKNGIRYYLAYGTLLGAIRYKKFIPWDDDVDVLVPREDYEKLLDLFKDDEKYKLFAFEKNNKFQYPFAKLCDMTTRKEELIYKKQNTPLGVEIDIFPIDAWESNFEKAKKEAERIKKEMIWLQLTEIEKPLTHNPLKRLKIGVQILWAQTIGSQVFVKRIIKWSKNTPYYGAKYLGSKTWCIYGERGIIPAEVFSDTVNVEFEGEIFPAPIGYDTYLTCLYGDYMPEPPIEKRKTHHAFRAYKV